MTLPAAQKPRKRGIDDVITEDGAEAFAQVVAQARPVHATQLGAENLTDLGNAKRLVRRHGEDFRYVVEFKTFYVWDGQRWQASSSSRPSVSSPPRDWMHHCSTS